VVFKKIGIEKGNVADGFALAGRPSSRVEYRMGHQEQLYIENQRPSSPCRGNGVPDDRDGHHRVRLDAVPVTTCTAR